MGTKRGEVWIATTHGTAEKIVLDRQIRLFGAGSDDIDVN